jgi:hypothetical protein
MSLELPEHGKRKTAYNTKILEFILRYTLPDSKTFYVVKRSSDLAWIKRDFFPDKTVEQARNEASRTLPEFTHGIDPSKIQRATKGELTFLNSLLHTTKSIAMQKLHGKMICSVMNGI